MGGQLGTFAGRTVLRVIDVIRQRSPACAGGSTHLGRPAGLSWQIGGGRNLRPTAGGAGRWKMIIRVIQVHRQIPLRGSGAARRCVSCRTHVPALPSVPSCPAATALARWEAVATPAHRFDRLHARVDCRNASVCPSEIRCRISRICRNSSSRPTTDPTPCPAPCGGPARQPHPTASPCTCGVSPRAIRFRGNPLWQIPVEPPAARRLGRQSAGMQPEVPPTEAHLRLRKYLYGGRRNSGASSVGGSIYIQESPRRSQLLLRSTRSNDCGRTPTIHGGTCAGGWMGRGEDGTREGEETHRKRERGGEARKANHHDRCAREQSAPRAARLTGSDSSDIDASPTLSGGRCRRQPHHEEVRTRHSYQTLE